MANGDSRLESFNWLGIPARRIHYRVLDIERSPCRCRSRQAADKQRFA